MRFALLMPLSLGACTGVEPLTGPGEPGSGLQPEANISFLTSAIDIRVGFDGVPIPREPVLLRPGENRICEVVLTPLSSDLIGRQFGCNEIHEVAQGSYQLVVRWYGQEIAAEEVAVIAEQTLIRNYDLGSRASRLEGRLLVNGAVRANGFLCAVFDPNHSRVCGTTASDGRFSLLVRAGAGLLTLFAGEGAIDQYSATGGQTTPLGDVSFETAALLTELYYDGELIDLGNLDQNTCGGRLTRPSQSSFLRCNEVRDVGEAGEWGMQIFWLREELANEPVVLITGQTVVRKFDLTPRAGVITARLTLNGKLLVDRPVFVRTSTGAQVQTQTGSDGVVSLLLPAGPSEFIHGGFGTSSTSDGFDVIAGRTTDVGVLNFAPAALEVELRYLGQPADPLLGSGCLVLVNAGGVNCASRDMLLPPSTYTVALRWIGGTISRDPVTLSPGVTAPITFDLSTTAGVISGQATLNGHAFPSGFLVCAHPSGAPAESRTCVSRLTNGEFSLLVPTGPGELLVGNAPPQPYVAVAGTTVRIGEPGETPAGSDVEVSPTDETTGEESPIELVFDNVTSSGTTTVTSGTVGGGGGPPPPANFRLGSPPTYYNIETTANYDGTITVCLSYSGVSYGNERQLKLLHGETDAGGNVTNWVDVTKSLDTENDVICGEVTTLSPFLAAESNVAPVVTGMTLPAAPIALGSAASLTASFADENPADVHTATIDWEGATVAGTITEASGSGTVAGVRTYFQAGVYTAAVTVSDGDLSGSRSSALDVPAYIVVYDPSGGFVTGGGWITSPAGAYAPEPALTGKATFGFVSRYRPGATTPSGNTEFQFKTANLTFRSTSYQWLVVAGSRAQYKGEGSLNEVGGYGFLLTAIDGNQGNGPDRFRIKIWESASGNVVYDNQPSAAEDSDASTALGGGSIVIHK